ncbi:MAG: hypothetical protein IH600_09820 [Bacteroidetes bacterium]|nr:hypothetical protein [Bacteroidota bacterium]
MRHFILFLTLCAALFPSIAGETVLAQDGLAHGGPDGIYVDLGNWILPAAVGGSTVTAYRLERRIAGSRQWTTVRDITGPQSAAELSTNLAALGTRFPELRDVTIDAAGLWQRIEQGRDLKSIGVATRLLPVQLALGVRYLDDAAERAQLTEYRISHVLSDGSVREAFTTPAVTWPGVGEVSTLSVDGFHGETTSTRVTFRVGNGLPPSAFRVYRREGITGPFAELASNVTDSCCIVNKGLTSRGDTIFCVVIDKLVGPGTVYQYYAVPMDYFRNEGLPSDTATVMSFRMTQVPLPERMKVRSIDTAGLMLTWKIREASAVHGILIERGPKIDSGFVELFTAGAKDTSFLDMTVTPMTRYYYRLRIVGPEGMRSSPSAVLIGIWKTSEAPTPPMGVQAEGVPGGVRISWNLDTTQQLDGYFIFRTPGGNQPMQQISNRIPMRETSFVDTLGLQGMMTYLYAVLSENSSHVQSPLSDTVSAIPQIAVPVETPRDLITRVVNGQVALYWNQRYTDQPACIGYRIYRKEDKTGRWRPLNDVLTEPWQNSFTDTGVEPGGTYQYTVRAFGLDGDSSSLSLVAHAAIPLPEVYPPANLTAQPQGRVVTLRWDEIAQPSAKEFRLYRYTRGAKPKLVKTLSLDIIGYTDEIKDRQSPVFYYLTTVGNLGQESRPGKEVAVMVK